MEHQGPSINCHLPGSQLRQVQINFLHIFLMHLDGLASSTMYTMSYLQSITAADCNPSAIQVISANYPSRNHPRHIDNTQQVCDRIITRPKV